MATLVIACPICLQKIRAPGNVLGRQIKCPQCKNGFTAVDPNAVAPEAPAAPRKELPPPPKIEEEFPAADPLGLDDELPLPTKPSGGGIGDYLMFRRMVTPVIVTAMFYFGVAVILLVGLIFGVMSLVGAITVKGAALMSLLSILIDFVATISALVMWRVLCEVVLILFRIHDQLRERPLA